MDLSHLFPSMEKLKLIQGIENNLLKRRRLANISIVFALAFSVLQVLVDVIAKNYKIKHIAAYFHNFGKFIYNLITFNWTAAGQYEPVWELSGFFFVLAFLLFYIILKRTKFLFKYSEEPFRYTFWVEPFKHVKDTESEVHKIDEDDRFHYLLHHDLMEKLNERIRRMSLLDAKNLDRKLKSNLSSHIHIEGHFTIRKLEDNHCAIQIMPRIRIGSLQNPVTLAKPIEFKPGYDSAACQFTPLEKGSAADPYERIVEHLYSRTATEIYRQIKSDLNEKIRLFPSKYLRAVALFHEAEDFARSNTIDAYEHAIDLYRQSLRCFDITFVPGITRLLIKYPLLWRFGVNVQHTLARVQIGYAKCQLYRRIISALSGRYLNPLFEIRSSLKCVISSLVEIHNRINPRLKLEDLQNRQVEHSDLEDARRKNHFKTSMAYLTFPKDSWKRFLFLRPHQALFERQKRIFFDANIVLSLTHTHLGSIQRAKHYLEDAKAIAPALSERNALYLVASALSEPELEKRIPLLNRATEIAPDFEIAQYMFAYYLEMQFRMRDEIVEARGISVFNEYEKVLIINPGNIASLASQGYLRWLLQQSTEAKRKLEEGRDIKAIVSDTFIGTLNYGLARIEAEDGNFDKSYDLINEALSSDPGVGAWSLESEKIDPLFRTSYFDYIDKSMLQRYRQFKENVEAIIGGSSRSQKKKPIQKSNRMPPAATDKTLSRVHSFVLNDYGNACLNYYHRFGDRVQLENAIQACEESISKDPEYKIAYFNLQNAYEWRNNPEDAQSGGKSDREKGVQLLKEITGFGPSWPLAITSLARARLKIGQEEIKELLRKANDEIQKAEASKNKLEVEDPSKKLRKFHRQKPDDREQQIIAQRPGLERKKRQIKSKRDERNILVESTKSKSSYYAIQEEILDSNLLELQKSVNEHIKRAETYFNRARVLSQNYTEKVLPEIEKIVNRTKLSSIYRGYEFNVAGQGIEDFLDQKTKVNKDRLDENDVEALMVWVEVLSNNYQDLDQNIKAVKELVNYVQKEYYPESSKLNLILKDMNELRLLYYQVQSVLEKVDKREDIEQCRKEIDAYSRPVKTMIENWLGNDPNHWASLLWAKEFFEKDKYIQYLKGAKRNAMIQNELGNIYVEKNHYERSLKYYQKALAIDERPIYACNLGRSYGDLGNWDEMIHHCTRAVELRRDAASDAYGLDYYYDFLAEGYYKANRLPEFEDLLKKTEDFIEAPQKMAVVYNRIGNLLANDARDNDAISYYQQAIRLDPQKSIYQCNLGITYGDLKQWDEMIDRCKQAIELRRTTPDDSYGLDYYYNFLAQAYFNADRLPEFEDFFETANDFRDKPQEIGTIYNWIGILFFGVGKNDEAIAYYKQAITYDSQKPIYECNLGRTYGNLGKWKEMIHHCTRAVELARYTTSDAFGLEYYYDFLAEGYYKASRLPEFEDLLKKTEDFIDAPQKMAVVYNRIGNLLSNDARDNDAISYYQQAIRLDPQRSIYRCNMGITYGKLKQWDEMIADCTQAIELRKTTPDDSYGLDYYYSFLAEAYFYADRLSQFEDFIESTEDFRDKPEEIAAIYNRIANLFFGNVKDAEAITFYKKAIMSDSQKPIYECNLARAYGNLGHWDEMIKHCERAVELRKNTASDPYELDYYLSYLEEGYRKAGKIAGQRDTRQKTG